MSSRTRNAFIIIGLLCGVFFASAANAQVVPTNLWNPNYGSSTITPRPSTLQVPCANIVGGCSSGGGVSTSTTNTFTVPQNFNGISNTGNVTSTSFTTVSVATPTYILNLNTYYSFPTPAQLAAGATCGNVTGVTDAGACVADFQLASLLIGSSTPISVPAGKYNYSIGIQATSTQRLVLSCPAAGATIFNYTGTSSPALWIDTQSYDNNVYYDHISGSEVDNCAFFGQTATTTPGVGATGGLVGGSNVTPHVRLNNVTFHDFSTCLNLASNTYDFESTNIIETDCGGTLLVNSYNNSGEGIKFFNPFWADAGNSSSSNCIVLATGSVSDFEVFGGSKDQCGFHIEDGNLGVAIYSLHDEDPGDQYYTPYYRYQIDSSLSTTVSFNNIGWYEDGTSTTPSTTALINCGAVCTAEGGDVYTNGADLTSFMTNTASPTNGKLTVKDIYIANSGVQNTLTNVGGILPLGGEFSVIANSWPIGCGQSSINIYECTNDGVVPFTLSSNRTLMAGLNSATPTAATSTIQADGTFGTTASVTGASSTLTTKTAGLNVFTGGAPATATLPNINASQGTIEVFKNRGTAAESISASSTAGDSIWLSATNSTATTYSLSPAQAPHSRTTGRIGISSGDNYTP